MNKIYKLKYSRSRNQVVVCSELETAADHSVNKQVDLGVKNSSTKKLVLGMMAAVPVLSALTGTAIASPQLDQLVKAATDQYREGLVVEHGQLLDVQKSTQDAKEFTKFTTKGNSVFTWKKFNIGSNEVVEFLQDSANSAVLNRVIGNQASTLLGALKSNGSVFVINPSGVAVGKNAVIDAQSVVLSTLDLSKEDFLAHKNLGKDLKFRQLDPKSQATAHVLNKGLITVKDGSIALIGGKAINKGVLEARNGTVYLLAGNQITLQDLNNPHVSYKVNAKNAAVNLGAIIANKATLVGNKVLHGASAAAAFADIVGANDEQAKAASIVAGQVLLHGGSLSDAAQSTKQANAQVKGERNGLVVVGGKIDAKKAALEAAQTTKAAKAQQPKLSGGQIEILGDIVVVEADAQVRADGVNGGSIKLGGDAKGAGNVKLALKTTVKAGAEVSASAIDASVEGAKAGVIHLWGDQAKVDGTFRASSQAVNGQGGFLETSGKSIQVGSVFKAEVEGQKAGEWLLDPEYLFVLNGSKGEAFSTDKLPTQFPEGTPGVDPENRARLTVGDNVIDLSTLGATGTEKSIPSGVDTTTTQHGSEYTVSADANAQFSYIYDQTLSEYFRYPALENPTAKTFTLEASKLTYFYKSRVFGGNPTGSDNLQDLGLERVKNYFSQRTSFRDIGKLVFSTANSQNAALVFDDAHVQRFGTLQASNGASQYGLIALNNSLLDSVTIDLSAKAANVKGSYLLSPGYFSNPGRINLDVDVSGQLKFDGFVNTFSRFGNITLSGGSVVFDATLNDSYKPEVSINFEDSRQSRTRTPGIEVTAKQGDLDIANVTFKSEGGYIQFKSTKGSTQNLVKLRSVEASALNVKVDAPDALVLASHGTVLSARNYGRDFVELPADAPADHPDRNRQYSGTAKTSAEGVVVHSITNAAGEQLPTGVVSVKAKGVYLSNIEGDVPRDDLLTKTYVQNLISQYFSDQDVSSMSSEELGELFANKATELETQHKQATDEYRAWQNGYVELNLGSGNKSQAKTYAAIYLTQSLIPALEGNRDNFHNDLQADDNARLKALGQDWFQDSTLTIPQITERFKALVAGTYTGALGDSATNWKTTNNKYNELLGNIQRIAKPLSELKLAARSFRAEQRTTLNAGTLAEIKASQEVYLGSDRVNFENGALTFTAKTAADQVRVVDVTAPFIRLSAPRITVEGYQLNDPTRSGYIEVLSTTGQGDFNGKKSASGIDFQNTQLLSCYIDVNAGSGALTVTNQEGSSSAFKTAQYCGHLSPNLVGTIINSKTKKINAEFTGAYSALPNFDHDKYKGTTSASTLPERFQQLAGANIAAQKPKAFPDDFDPEQFNKNIDLIGKDRYDALKQHGLLPESWAHKDIAATSLTPEQKAEFAKLRRRVSFGGSSVELGKGTFVLTGSFDATASTAGQGKFSIDAAVDATSFKVLDQRSFWRSKHELSNETSSYIFTSEDFSLRDFATVEVKNQAVINVPKFQLTDANTSTVNLSGYITSRRAPLLIQNKNVSATNANLVSGHGVELNSTNPAQSISLINTEVSAPEIVISSAAKTTIAGNTKLDTSPLWLPGNRATLFAQAVFDRQPVAAAAGIDRWQNADKNWEVAELAFLANRCALGTTNTCDYFLSENNQKAQVLRLDTGLATAYSAYKNADGSADYLFGANSYRGVASEVTNLYEDASVYTYSAYDIQGWNSGLSSGKTNEITVKGASVVLEKIGNLAPTLTSFDRDKITIESEVAPTFDPQTGEVTSAEFGTFSRGETLSGKVNVIASTGDVELNGANVTSSNVELQAVAGKVTVKGGSEVNATVGNLDITAGTGIALENSKLTASNTSPTADQGKVNLKVVVPADYPTTGPAPEITVLNSHIAATNTIDVKAEEQSTGNTSPLNSKNRDVAFKILDNAEGSPANSASTLVGLKGVKAEVGSIDLNGGDLVSQQGSVDLKANRGNLSSTANLVGGTGVELTASYEGPERTSSGEKPSAGVEVKGGTVVGPAVALKGESHIEVNKGATVSTDIANAVKELAEKGEGDPNPLAARNEALSAFRTALSDPQNTLTTSELTPDADLTGKALWSNKLTTQIPVDPSADPVQMRQIRDGDLALLSGGTIETGKGEGDTKASLKGGNIVATATKDVTLNDVKIDQNPAHAPEPTSTTATGSDNALRIVTKNPQTDVAAPVSLSNAELTAATGSVQVIGDSVTLEDSVALAKKGDVIVKADNGNAELKNSQALGGRGVSIQAEGNDSKVLVENSDVAGPAVQLHSAAGKVEVTGASTVTTDKDAAGALQVKKPTGAQNPFANAESDSTSVTADTDATWFLNVPNADPQVSLTDRGYKGTPNPEGLKTGEEPNYTTTVDLQEGQLSAYGNKGVEVKETPADGTSPAKTPTLSTNGGNLDLVAHEGKVEVDGATVKATGADVNLAAPNEVVVNNANVVATADDQGEGGHVNIQLTNNDPDSADAQSIAIKGSSDISAKQVTVDAVPGPNLHDDGKPTAGRAAVEVTGSSLTGEDGVAVTASSDLTLTDSNVKTTGAGPGADVDLTSNNGAVSLNNTTAAALGTGDVNIVGTSVTLDDKSKAYTPRGIVDLEARKGADDSVPTGDVTVQGTIVGGRGVKVANNDAGEGKGVVFDGSTVAGPAITVETNGKVDVKGDTQLTTHQPNAELLNSLDGFLAEGQTLTDFVGPDGVDAPDNATKPAWAVDATKLGQVDSDKNEAGLQGRIVEQGEVSLRATKDVTFSPDETDATKRPTVDADGKVNIQSTDGNATLVGDLHAKTELNVDAKDKITAKDAVVTVVPATTDDAAKAEIKFDLHPAEPVTANPDRGIELYNATLVAKSVDLDATPGKLTTKSGSAIITDEAQKLSAASLDLNDSTFVSKDGVLTLEATEGDVSAKNVTGAGAKGVQILANANTAADAKQNINLEDSQFYGPAVVAAAKNDLNVTGDSVLSTDKAAAADKLDERLANNPTAKDAVTTGTGDLATNVFKATGDDAVDWTVNADETNGGLKKVPTDPNDPNSEGREVKPGEVNLSTKNGNLTVAAKKDESGAYTGNAPEISGTDVTLAANAKDGNSEAGKLTVAGSPTDKAKVAASGDLVLTSDNGTTVENADLSGKNLTVNAENGLTSVKDSTLLADEALKVTGDSVTLDKTGAVAKRGPATLAADNGDLSVKDSKVFAGGGVVAKAEKPGDADKANVNITGDSVLAGPVVQVHADGDVNVQGPATVTTDREEANKLFPNDSGLTNPFDDNSKVATTKDDLTADDTKAGWFFDADKAEETGFVRVPADPSATPAGEAVYPSAGDVAVNGENVKLTPAVDDEGNVTGDKGPTLKSKDGDVSVGATKTLEAQKATLDAQGGNLEVGAGTNLDLTDTTLKASKSDDTNAAATDSGNIKLALTDKDAINAWDENANPPTKQPGIVLKGIDADADRAVTVDAVPGDDNDPANTSKAKVEFGPGSDGSTRSTVNANNDIKVVAGNGLEVKDTDLNSKYGDVVLQNNNGTTTLDNADVSALGELKVVSKPGADKTADDKLVIKDSTLRSPNVTIDNEVDTTIEGKTLITNSFEEGDPRKEFLEALKSDGAKPDGWDESVAGTWDDAKDNKPYGQENILVKSTGKLTVGDPATKGKDYDPTKHPTITGAKDVTLEAKELELNPSKVTAEENVTLKGTDSLTADGLVADAGKKLTVELTPDGQSDDASKKLDLKNVDLKGGTKTPGASDNLDEYGVTINNPVGEVNITADSPKRSKIEAVNGDLDISGQGKVNLEHTDLKAADELKVEVKGDNAKLTLTDSTAVGGTKDHTGENRDPAPTQGVKLINGNGDIEVTGGSTVKAERGDASLDAPKGYANLTDGSKVQAPEGNVTVNAGKGVNVKGSEVSAGDLVDIHIDPSSTTPDAAINLDNATVVGGLKDHSGTDPKPTQGVKLTNPKGDIAVTNASNVTAQHGDVTLDAAGNANITGRSVVNAPEGNVTVTAKKGIDVSGEGTKVSSGLQTSLTIPVGSDPTAKVNVGTGATVEGGTKAGATDPQGVAITNNVGDIEVGGTVNAAHGDAVVKAPVGNVNVTATGTVKAPEGNVTIEANKGINVDGSVSSGLKTSLTIPADGAEGAKVSIGKTGSVQGGTKSGATDPQGVDITNNKGDIDIKGTVDAVNGDVNAKTPVGRVNVTDGATVKAPQGNVTIDAHSGIKVDGDGTSITSGDKTKLLIPDTGANGATIDITGGAKVEGGTKEGSTNPQGVDLINNKGDVNLNNGTVTAPNGDVTIATPNGSTNVTNGSEVSAPKGNVSITAKEGANLENSTLTSGDLTSVVVTGPRKDGTPAVLNLNNATVEGGTQPGGRGVQLTNNDQNGFIKSENSTLTAPNGNIDLTAPNGNISLTKTNASAPNGNVTLTAKDKVDLTESNLHAGDKLTVNLTGPNPELNLKDSNLLAGTKDNSGLPDPKPEQGIALHNPNGTVNLDGSQVQTHKGNIDLTANVAAITNSTVETGVPYNGKPGAEGDINLDIGSKLDINNSTLAVKQKGDVKIVNHNKAGLDPATNITDSTITVPRQPDQRDILDENGNLKDPAAVNQVTIKTENGGNQVVTNTTVDGTVVDIVASGDQTIDLDKIKGQELVVVESERGNLTLQNATIIDANTVKVLAGLGDRNPTKPYDTDEDRNNRNHNAVIDISAESCLPIDGLTILSGSGKGVTYVRGSSCDPVEFDGNSVPKADFDLSEKEEVKALNHHEVTLSDVRRNGVTGTIEAAGSAPYRGRGGVTLPTGPGTAAALTALAERGLLDPEKLLGTCGVALVNFVDEFHIDLDDLKKLSREELKAKYGISEARMVEFEKSCGDFGSFGK